MDFPTISITLYTALIWAQFYFLCAKTHFIEEYSTLLGQRARLRIDDFKVWEETNPGQSYFVYLRCTREGWLYRLLGCPFCLITFGSVATFAALGLLKLSLWFWLFSLAPAFIGCISYLLIIWIYSKVFPS